MSDGTIITLGDCIDFVIDKAGLKSSDAIRLSIKKSINAIYQEIATKSPYVWTKSEIFLKINKKHTTGTVSLTQGSAIVNGTGTSFTSDMIGRKFYVVGSKNEYTVKLFYSSTKIELDNQWIESTSSSASYVIHQDAVGLPPNLESIRYIKPIYSSINKGYTPISELQFEEKKSNYYNATGIPELFCVAGKKNYNQKTWTTFRFGSDFFQKGATNSQHDKRLRYYPSTITQDIFLRVVYSKVVPVINSESDKFMLPLGKSKVLALKHLSEYFLQQRNYQAYGLYKAEFNELMKDVEADIEELDSDFILYVNPYRYTSMQGYYIVR